MREEYHVSYSWNDIHSKAGFGSIIITGEMHTREDLKLVKEYIESYREQEYGVKCTVVIINFIKLTTKNK